jgi:hypothetical protein
MNVWYNIVIKPYNSNKRLEDIHMSFISAVVGYNYISMVTDGRAMNNGIIVDEDCPKMQEPIERLFIGYTGLKEECERIVRESTALSTNLRDLNSLSEIMKSKSSEVLHDKVFFIIAGVNNEGDNQLITLSNVKDFTNEIALSSTSSLIAV